MPADAVSQNALVVIAVAMSVQALLFVGLATALALLWKRLEGSGARRLDALESKIDIALADARRASLAVDRVSDEAGVLMRETANLARSVVQLAAAPRTLLVAGAASAARGLMSRWRRRHPRPGSLEPSDSA